MWLTGKRVQTKEKYKLRLTTKAFKVSYNYIRQEKPQEALNLLVTEKRY
jgi:hypothetical protein